MRVLFFANSTSTPKSIKHGYNGTGWIASLQNELAKRTDIQIAVACIANYVNEKIYSDNVTYYFIQRLSKTFGEKILGGLQYKSNKYELKRWPYYEQEFAKIINDFNPDIIHIFGSEFYYGLVASLTRIPVVLHIQGILNPYLNAWFPPGISPMSFYFQDFNPYRIWHRFQIHAEWHRECYREREIFHRVNNFIGRTDWDKACTMTLNPNAKYFYGSEILRPVFYESKEREIPNKATIITTISQPMYKGYDMILKTAQLIKSVIGDSFIWQVYGNIEPRYMERNTGIRHDKVNVELCGVATAEQLHKSLLNSSVYFHPSYIDNSPNSVCEAQITGCPVVVTDVGGVSSLVQNRIDGYIVPANDPYMAAYRIISLIKDSDINYKMGQEAKKNALMRHDRKKIIDDLLETYNQIL